MNSMKISVKILLSFLTIALLCAISVLVLSLPMRAAIQSLADVGTTQAAPATAAAAAAQLRRALVTAYVLVGATFVMAIAIWQILAQNLTRPLAFLAQEISGIAQTGNIYIDDAAYKQTKVLNKRGDEIGIMSRAVGDLLAMLRNKAQSLKAISGGDLSVRVDLRSPRDTVGTELDKMVKNLNGMFANISTATGQVAMRSRQMADGVLTLSQGSMEQAHTVEDLSSSVAEIAQRTKDNADMAGRAAALANTIMQNAEKGSRQMGEMTAAVTEINQASQGISKIIGVINDIAFQTNILALNAAVEAARAGQHGKGFAVVAEEVRNLAAKSAEAARETGSLIEDSAVKARLGSRIAGETADSLAQIVAGINESTRLVNSIAKSSDEQTQSIGRLNRGIDQVVTVIRQNSATTMVSAAASGEMSSQSALLEESIARFKLISG